MRGLAGKTSAMDALFARQNAAVFQKSLTNSRADSGQITATSILMRVIRRDAAHPSGECLGL